MGSEWSQLFDFIEYSSKEREIWTEIKSQKQKLSNTSPFAEIFMFQIWLTEITMRKNFIHLFPMFCLVYRFPARTLRFCRVCLWSIDNGPQRPFSRKLHTAPTRISYPCQFRASVHTCIWRVSVFLLAQRPLHVPTQDCADHHRWLNVHPIEELCAHRSY